MSAENDTSPLAVLLRRREEVRAWLDGPVKKVTLTAIEHEIDEQRQARSAGLVALSDNDVSRPRTAT